MPPNRTLTARIEPGTPEPGRPRRGQREPPSSYLDEHACAGEEQPSSQRNRRGVLCLRLLVAAARALGEEIRDAENGDVNRTRDECNR